MYQYPGIVVRLVSFIIVIEVTIKFRIKIDAANISNLTHAPLSKLERNLRFSVFEVLTIHCCRTIPS